MTGMQRAFASEAAREFTALELVAAMTRAKSVVMSSERKGRVILEVLAGKSVQKS